MFGLSEPHWNIVKSQARKLNEAVKAMPANERKSDKLMIEVISIHHKPVETIIDRLKFTWTAGYLAGRVGNKTNGDYE